MKTNTVCLDLQAYNDLLINNMQMNNTINKYTELTSRIYNVINSNDEDNVKIDYITKLIETNVVIEKESEEVENGN